MKRRISLLLVLSMLLGLTVPVSADILKPDVQGHWAEEVISALLFAGMANGYPDGEFKPDNNINVDEFIALVTRVLSFEIKPAEEGYWAETYIAKAKEEGFLPDEIPNNYARPILREEMCAIITKAFSAGNDADIFSAIDEDEIAPEYKEAVRAAYNAKIVTGYEDGSFRPKGELTRAEACQVLITANAYDPDGSLPFEEITYYPFQNGEGSPWKFYAAVNWDTDRSKYVPMKVAGNDKEGVASVAGDYALPYISWESPSLIDPSVYIRPERDDWTASGNGAPIIEFTAPRGGNYEFNIDIQNIGADVFGGDGAYMSITFYGPNNNIDATVVATYDVMYSPSPVYNYNEVIKLKRGQSIAVRFISKMDGFADKLRTKFTVKTTQKKGKVYVNNGLSGILSTPPAEKMNSSAPYKENLVWIGVDGGFAASRFAPDVWDTVRKYVPNLAILPNLGKPEEFKEAAEYYRKEGIPTIIQSWSTGSEQYFDAVDAWEVGWDGRVANRLIGGLGGTGHAAAMSSTARHDWAERIVRSSARSGYGGFGFIDLIWFYNFGAGKATHHPETIAAFKKDLKGEDEGLLLQFGDAEPELWHFKDYAAYYLGAMIEPEDLGLSSWDAYSPVTKEQYENEPDKNWSQWDTLATLLMSYEYLRFAQHIVQTADEEGVNSQILPNPEDAGNAVDCMFVQSLYGIELFTDEFFRGPYYLDGAYSRYDYLSSRKSSTCSPGIVLECGNGGNAGSYYDIPIAYLVAYEIGASTDSTHFEVDFMVQNQTTIEGNSALKDFVDRYQAVMSYAMGYNDSQKDNLQKYDKDFYAVSSRRVNLPWGEKFAVWEWGEKYRANAEYLLSKNGYLFEGIAEDGIMSIDPNQEFILYNPDRPTKYHFDYVKENMEKGSFKNIFSTAMSLRSIVDQKFRHVDMSEYYPEFDFEEKPEITLSGNITDNNGNVIAENIAIESTTLWSHPDWETVLSLGDTPIVVKRDFGEGTMYMYCLDPDQEPCYYASKAAYDYVLNMLGIEKHFDTIETRGELLEGYSGASPKESRGAFEENATVYGILRTTTSIIQEAIPIFCRRM